MMTQKNVNSSFPRALREPLCQPSSACSRSNVSNLVLHKRLKRSALTSTALAVLGTPVLGECWAAGAQVWQPHGRATRQLPILAVELKPCCGSGKQMLRTHIYRLVLSSAFQLFNTMCPTAKIADTPLVWKDQTWLERSYSGHYSDTVDFTMEWGLEVYLFSNEEKDKQILRERSALHKPFKTLSFCHMPKQHHYACQKSEPLPTKDTVCQASKWSLTFRPQIAQAGKGRDAALQCPGCRTGRSPCLHPYITSTSHVEGSGFHPGAQAVFKLPVIPPPQPKAAPILQHEAAGIC